MFVFLHKKLPLLLTFQVRACWEISLGEKPVIQK